MEFQREMYTIPKDCEELLNFIYCKDWRTPIAMFNFKMNKIERIKAFMMQYIKALLPDAITEILQDYKNKYCCPIKPPYTAISSLNPAEIGMISSNFKFQAPPLE